MSNKDYPTLESLIKYGLKYLEDSNKTFCLILMEVKSFRKKMLCLPTSREMEAESELKMLRDISVWMLKKDFSEIEDLIFKNDKLEKLIYEDLISGTCSDFLKTRIYTNKILITISDEMMSNFIVYCSKRLELGRLSIYNVINVILDNHQEFYKNNGKETNLFAWAFGVPNELDLELKQWIDNLQKGDHIDVLRSVSNKQIWTRGTFDFREGSFWKIKYLGESNGSFIANPHLEIRPYKSMSVDYEWRESLKEGDLVDYHSFRSGWILTKIVNVLMSENFNGDLCKQIEIKREYPPGDDRADNVNKDHQSSAGYINVNYYDEFSTPVRQLIHSPSIAQPYTCSLRSTSQIDDSADGNFTLSENDSRIAILRPNMNSGISSTYFVKYVNVFSLNKGFHFIEKCFRNQNQLNNDLFSEAVFLLKNTADCLLRSYILQKGQQFINDLSNYMGEFIEKNIRNYSQNYLSNFIDAVSVLYFRVYKSVEANSSILEFIIRAGIVCLKSEILDKQFFGAKLILNYENQLREVHNKRFQEKLVNELLTDNLFEKILKGHPSLIGKSLGIIKWLFTGNFLKDEHVDVMWNLVVKTDSESRQSLVSLLKELTLEMNREHIRSFCQRILDNPGELTLEILELIDLLKRYGVTRLEDKGISNLVSAILWKNIQSEKELKKEVNKELIKVFVRFIKYDLLDNYVPQIVENIALNNNRMRNSKLLVSFLKESSISTDVLIKLIKETKLFDHCVHDVCEKIRTLSQKSLKIAIHSMSNLQQLPSSKPNDTSSEIQREVKKLLKLMRLVLFSKYTSIDDELFPFKNFELIFDELFKNSYTDKSCQDWLIEYIDQTHSDSFIENCSNFFTSKLNFVDEIGKEEFLVFFVAIFKKVNITQGKLVERQLRFISNRYENKKDSKIQLVCETNVNNFFGIDLIWDLYQKTSNKKLYRKIAQLISKVYLAPEFYEYDESSVYYDQKLKLKSIAIEWITRKQALDAQKASLLMIDLIRKDMNQRELFRHSVAQLRESEKIFINVEKDSKYIKDRNKFKLNLTSTIQDIKLKCSDYYKVNLNKVSLTKGENKSISDFDHFQTLENMEIKEYDLLIYVESNIPETHEVELLNSTRTGFSDRLKLVWKEVFDEFSENGIMTKSQYEKLTAKATNISIKKASKLSERIKEIFIQYAIDDGQHLTYEGLLSFYTDSALEGFERREIVKDNLRDLGYDKDYRLKKDRHEGIETKSLRVELCDNQTFMKDLFEIVGRFRPNGKLQTDNQTDDVENDLCFVLRLFDLLPIGSSEIDRLLNDPIGYFSEPVREFIWNYKITLLHAFLFRKDFVDNLTLHVTNESELSIGSLIDKISNKEFFDILLSWISRVSAASSFKNTHSLISMTITTLEKLLRSVVEITDIDFHSIYSEFGRFFQKKHSKAIDHQTKIETSNKLSESNHQNASMLTHVVFNLSRIQKITNSIDFETLNSNLIILMSKLNKIPTPISHSIRSLMKTSIFLMVSSIKMSKVSFRGFISQEDFKELILDGLTHEEFQFKKLFNNLCRAVSYLYDDVKIKIDLLKVLISNLKLKKGEESSSLVDVSCSILDEIGEMKSIDSHVADIIHSEFNFNSLFTQFKDELMSHKSKETSSSNSEDTQLICLLAFLEHIVNADEMVLTQIDNQTKLNFMHHLFTECLFKIEDKSIDFTNVKCHSAKSRKHAFGLLIHLLKSSIRMNVHFMVSEVSSLVRHIPPLTFSSVSTHLPKDQSVYRGITNLGCICYMIATLQQFYCIPAFRYSILMADDREEAKPADNRGVQTDDNYFHQFQRLLSYLDFSDRPKVNPFDFCMSYKDSSNNPVNIAIQQDADEFLKIFLDKMELKLKNTPFLTAINSVCLGKICNKIKCQGCGHIKLNSENFYNLSLEIKGMKDINESLNKLIEPEIISDYMCDNCKKKCDISKQVLLESLPNMLFLSLKKMYFDLELLANVKLHSRYHFPMTINLSKYMYIPESVDHNKDNLNDSDFEYNLKGVVIHRGNADAGHYTSLIKADPYDPARKIEENDKWFEYDDSRVTPFEMRKFDEECFGPTEEKDVMSLLSTEMDSSKSAYLLVFEKTLKKDLEFDFTDQTIHLKEFIVDNLIDPTKHVFEGLKLTTPFHNLKQFIPSVYRDEVTKDNKSQLLEQNLLCRTFTKSIAEILWNVDLSIPNNLSPSELNAILTDKRAFAEIIIKNAPVLLSKVYCVSSENESINQIVIVIERALMFFSAFSLIKSDQRSSIDAKLVGYFHEQIFKLFGSITSAILNSTDVNVQTALIEYVGRVISVIIKHFGIIHFEQTNPEDESPVEKFRHSLSQILLTIIFTISQNEEIPALFRKHGRMFALSHSISKDHPSVMNFFINRNVFATLLNVYFKFDTSKIHNGERTSVWILRQINGFYSYMISNIRLNPKFPEITSILLKLDLILKASKEDYRFEDYDTLKTSTLLFCYNDKMLSEVVIYSVLKQAGTVLTGDFWGCLEVLKMAINIDDGLMDYRIMCVLGIPRLNETNNYGFFDERRYLYGLGRESSLRKPYLTYLNPFGLDKGLLELIISNRDYYETQTISFIQLLLALMLLNNKVLDYVVKLPPANYISATFFDWFSCYANHHYKKEITEYNSFKYDHSRKMLTDVLEKIKLIEERIVHKYPSIDNRHHRHLFSRIENPYQSYYSTYSADRSDHLFDPLWSVKPVYLIGKTLGYELIHKIILEHKDKEHQLKVKFWLVKLALIESSPDGKTNFTFPESMIYSDLTLRNDSTQQSKLSSFFTPLHHPEGHEPSAIHSVFEDEIDENKPVKISAVDKLKSSKQRYELVDDPNYLNVKYMIRVSVTNTTTDSYFLKIWINGPNQSNFQKCDITSSVQGRKHNHLIHTICLDDVNSSFDGLSVKVAHKSSDYCNLRILDEGGFDLHQTQFVFRK